MDRQTFLKTSGFGLGMTLMPNIFHAATTAQQPVLKNPKIIKDKEGEMLNVIGDIQTHKLVGADTGNQITEWVDNVQPGVGIPPHVHTEEDESLGLSQGRWLSQLPVRRPF
ncbi:MAG: hypothetical protein WBG71_04180 [Leeuwenhoekiella sp.]